MFGETKTLSRNDAREQLEMLGFPLGAEAFARALATRHRPLIDLCFAAELEVDDPDSAGRTPLLIALLAQDFESASRLLTAGANCERGDELGITPLMAAAMHGQAALVRQILGQKVAPAAADRQGRLALHYALAAEKADAIEALLPVTEIESGAQEMFELALATKQQKIIASVLERTPPTLRWTSATREALAGALLTANRDRIRQLLEKHPAPPSPEGRTSPLLAYAIATNDTTLFDLLLSNGADPNTTFPSPCEKEFIPLVSANYLKHYLEGDSNVTVLMLAAGLGRTEYVRRLLAAGADRNRATPKNRMLAVYFASRSDSWEALQMLLGTGPTREQLRIEISIAQQQAVVIKDGSPIFTTEVSTGRSDFPTPTGYFVVTDKNRDHRSSIYKVPMPFFMRLSCRDFGLHEGVVPNYPASHGCIRVPASAARRLFSEIPVGTFVSIH